jgi:parallel beta-helix repeat protein
VVTSTADDGSAGTLRSIIAEADATSGETITFSSLFDSPQTITLDGEALELSSGVTINGPPDGVTISGNYLSGVFKVDTNVTATLTGLTITDGVSAKNGGGLYNQGNTTLNDCTVSNNAADGRFGGGVFNSGTLTMTGSTVSGNTTADQGAAFGGGGIFSTGTLNLTTCIVSGNTSNGIYSSGSASHANLSYCSISGNSFGYSGGGLINRGTATLTGCTLEGNVAGNEGGGIDNYGTITLTNCTVSENIADAYGGGGIVDSGTATLESCTIDDNQAPSRDGGGGLLIGGGMVTLTNCTVSGNSADQGGGMSTNDSLTQVGVATLVDCTLNDNQASLANGGGVNLASGSDVLKDCTISGNTANGDGGGFSVGSSSSLELTACTITGNVAQSGGGVNVGSGSANVSLIDTIIAGNTQTNSGLPNDIIGDVEEPSSEYNLVGTGGAGGMTNTDGHHNHIMSSTGGLDLAPLGYYGGPTETMALLSGSLAIGQGSASASGLMSDQRGEPDDTPYADIGAFQLPNGLQVDSGLSVNSTLDGEITPTGEMDLRQANNFAEALGGGTISFAAATGQMFATAQTITLSDGPLELSDTSPTITIDGPVAGVTISGDGATRVFVVDAGVSATISGVTISEGSTTGAGGGLYDYGTATLNDVTITNNSSVGDGGGVATSDGGSVTLTNCTIAGNTSGGDGGGVANAATGSAVLIDCTVSGNSSATAAGGVYLAGAGTLENTIVAGNTASGDPSDIGGTGGASGSNNLIGTGGSDGLTTGGIGNIVDVANPGLEPLADYGGPTDTMALIPDSPAIGAGIALSEISTDERGAPRSTIGAIDIGAFQDQGYSVTVSSGSPQAAMVNDAFSAPLVALLKEGFVNTPLPNVTVDFTAPTSGASASLSASSAVTDATGEVSITATANMTAGQYAVTANVDGASSASFGLTNRIQPIFSITSPASFTITYGDTVTLAGTVSAGKQVPTGEQVDVTVNNVTDDVTIGTDGSFSAQFSSGHGFLNASPTAYDVSYAYNSDGVFLGANTEVTGQLTVSPATLTISAVTDSKTYDGTTSSSLTPTTSGLISGDTILGLTQAFESKDVAGPGGSTLIVNSGYMIDDGNGGQNYIVPSPIVALGTITPATLTITAVFDSKTYDGTVTSSKMPNVSGLAPVDIITVSQAFQSKNVMGSGGSTLSIVSGYTVEDGDENDLPDYTVSTTGTAPGTISPIALTVTATRYTKTYDGTTSAGSVVPKIVNGSLATGDTADFTESFASANAGTGLTLSPSGIVDDGNNGQNYAYTWRSISSGVINPAPLTITAMTDSKTYDGTLNSSKTPTYSGLIPDLGDSVTELTQAFASKNVMGTDGSTLDVTGYTVNDGDGGHDYAVTTVSASGTITPASLTITAISDAKFYDGTTNSSLTPTYSPQLFGSDTVAELTQAFESKNALGIGGNSLNVTAWTVNDGDGGDDYTVTTVSVTGTIKPEPLTITAVSDTRVYDGTMTATEAPSVTSGNVAPGDTAQFSETFNSANAGEDLTLTPSGQVDDGNNGNNYTYNYVPVSTGVIQPAPLTVTASNQTQVYGATTPTLTYSITGFVAGDKVSVVTGAPVVTTSAAAGAGVGTYSIKVAAGTLTATNYTFPAADLIAGTLTVTPAPLVVTAISTSMPAGGPAPAFAATYTGFVNGDTAASLSSPPTFYSSGTTASAAGAYPIIVGGASSPNYTITYVPGTLTVNLPPLAIESVSVEKIKLKKHKTVTGIAVRFNEALNVAEAQNLSEYSLATIPKNKKQKSKPVALSSASYNPAAFTVTLLTRKPLVLSRPLDLTVKAVDYLGVLSKSGASEVNARASVGIGSLPADIVDAVLDADERDGR